jgi:hypothetical protein
MRFNGGNESVPLKRIQLFVLEGLVVHRRDLDVLLPEETSSSEVSQFVQSRSNLGGARKRTKDTELSLSR